MGKDSEGQLSFDWPQTIATSKAESSDEKQAFYPSAASSVVCFQTHKLKRDEQDRSYHFSQIIKLVAHLEP